MKKSFPSTITSKGITELGNLVEEYLLNHKLSFQKLVNLEILLMTYYMQTGNIIHEDTFNKIEKKIQKRPIRRNYHVKRSIEYLNISGCIEKNPKYVPWRKLK
jgi:hypothetical protein